LAGPGGKEAAAAAFTSYFTAAQPGGMFAQRHVNQDSQDTLLHALDSQLSQARHTSCDVAVTRDDLQTALLGTANNKAPGSDGLPFEFYRAFFFVTKALHVQVPAKTNLELANAIARVKAPEESKAEHDRTPATAPLKTHRGRTEPGQHSGDHTNMMGTNGLIMATT
jgi:hypothetical protein